VTRLEQLRLDAGMTRDQLATASGVTARTIHRLENGQSTGRVDNLVALASALNARPSELLRAAVWPPTSPPGGSSTAEAENRAHVGWWGA
jgi:transcriptional regulator with XRE-family HTH domain